MNEHQILKLLCNGPVIPAIRNINDFEQVLQQIHIPAFVLLFGDIISLPERLAEAQKHHKRIIVHLDLLEGVGKDKAGIQFLARAGVNAVVTTKPYLGKAAREAGMIVIQRIFLMDSDSLKSGINLLRSFNPDLVEVLPGIPPMEAVRELRKVTKAPILGGGLIRTQEDVLSALKNGACAVTTSRSHLWSMTV